MFLVWFTSKKFCSIALKASFGDSGVPTILCRFLALQLLETLCRYCHTLDVGHPEHQLSFADSRLDSTESYHQTMEGTSSQRHRCRPHHFQIPVLAKIHNSSQDSASRGVETNVRSSTWSHDDATLGVHLLLVVECFLWTVGFDVSLDITVET